MKMENPIFWITLVEGAAIVVLSVSILWMFWAKRTGTWATGKTADVQTPALPIEELRQLMEESQVITQNLAENLREKSGSPNNCWSSWMKKSIP